MAYTLDITKSARVEHTYEEKQYGSCDIASVDSGFKVHVSFSNGKKVDGDHFACSVILQNAAGEPIKGLQFKAGLNGAFFGKTVERHLDGFIELDNSQKAVASQALVSFTQFDDVNDRDFWEKMKKIASTIIEVLKEKPQRPPRDDLPR